MATRREPFEAIVERVDISVYRVPTDFPESDGTAEWDSTTAILVEVSSGGKRGLGYSYASESAAGVIREKLIGMIVGTSAMDTNRSWAAMTRPFATWGRPGIASTAISAMDVALWDLKGRLLDLPLVKLLGQLRESIPAYGSGGFTSYSLQQLYDQMHQWAQDGLKMVKMKIGREPDRDDERVRTARAAIGNEVQLFVDANGAYSCKQALAKAEIFMDSDVTWFEEPVSSDNLEGLRLIRNSAPSRLEIAAGEYGYDAIYFRRMLRSRRGGCFAGG